MELTLTFAALALGLGLASSMVWLQRRPKQALDTSLLPTTPLLILGAFIVLLAVVHLINLWGIHTGR